MCEIGMLIFGIISLIRGKFLLTRGKEVRGVPARIIGLVLVLPFPVSFALIILASTVLAVRGQPVNEENVRGMATIVEVTIVAICFFSAIGIAMATAKPIKKIPPEESRDVDVPDHARDRFRSKARDGADSQDIIERPPRPPARPDDRIQN